MKYLGGRVVSSHDFGAQGPRFESHWLTDGQVVFPGFSGFRPLLMNDRLDISEIFLKGP